MEVQIISETIQKFNGESFYLCGNYYQRKGKRLHRTVWEYYRGDIPQGYHVHHIDGDKSNNQIDNLALMLGSEHLKTHMEAPERREMSREMVKKAIEAAPEWHSSEAGCKWHSAHARKYWDNAPLRTYVCDYCGKEYQSKAVRHTGNHFCNGNCKAAFRRRRLRDENNKH